MLDAISRLDTMLREGHLRTHMILSSAVLEAAMTREVDLATDEQRELHLRAFPLLLQSLEAMRELVEGIEPCFEVALRECELTARLHAERH